MPTRRIVVVALPDVQALDVTGPADVFAAAGRTGGDPPAYAIEVVGPAGAPIATGAGYGIVPAGALEDVRGPVDTLLVAGGAGARHAPPTASSTGCATARSARGAWRPSAPARSSSPRPGCSTVAARRRTGAGATSCSAATPRSASSRDPIFVRDGDVLHVGGVTAGHGPRARARRGGPRPATSRSRSPAGSCVFVKRPGGQAQFSAQLAAQAADREPLRDLQAWMADHLDADLSVPALAARAYMSERNFARAFTAETGMTPAAYVEALRVERARLALEAGGLPVEAVARRLRLRHRRDACAARSAAGSACRPADYRSRFAA